MNFLGEEKLEAIEGRKSKPSLIQLIYSVFVIMYLAFYIYIGEVMSDTTMRNTIFAVMTISGLVLMTINAIYNRKRKDKSFVWSHWVFMTVLFFSFVFRYATTFFFKN